MKFADMTGKEWPVRRITFGDLDELAALGLDVEAVSADLSVLAELVIDRRRFAAVLWWFVGPAVEAEKLTPQDFHRRLDGDSLARGVEAVAGAVVDFFPYPPAAKARIQAKLSAGLWTPAPGGSDAAPSSSPPSPDSTPAP